MSLLQNPVKQLLARAEFHDHPQVVLFHIDVIDLNDVGVILAVEIDLLLFSE